MLHKDRVSRSLRSLASGLLALSVSSSTSTFGESGWINDGTDAAPQLSIEQSMWAMTGLPRGGPEWSLEEKVAKIAEAGFDGIMVFLPPNEAEEARYCELAKRHGLAITLHCAPSTVEDVERAIASAKRLGARAIVAMIRPAFVTYGEGEAKIRAMSAACEKAKVPFYVETHRGTVTQDLAMTASWARFVPGIRFHADLSHYAIAYEIAGEPDAKVRSFLDAILARTGMLDGRIGNGEQVQIDIGPDGSSPHAKRFAAWWKTAMRAWLEKAGPGDVFVFKSELGPPSYSIVDFEGKELSDQWAQALVLRDLAIRTWNEAVRESGKGQPYAAKGAKSLASAGAAGGLDRESALRVESSPIRTLRGDSHKIGAFHLAGQPLQPDFDDAKEIGVKSVINLRMERELGGLGFDEKDHVENVLGLEYHWIPVSPETIDDEMAEKLIRTLDEAAKPAIIHDSNGNRVWGVWALYVGTKFGVPFEETQRVATEHGIPKLVIDAFVRERLEGAKK